MSRRMIWIRTLANVALTLGAAVSLLALEVLVDLVGALAKQEESTEEQDHVAPGDLLPQNRKQRRGEPDDPAQ
jgi:hypothetical protein